MLVDLVLVNFHSATEAREAIRSARHELHPVLNRIIVVENGSGEADRFAGSGAEVLVFAENRGFAAGVNAGVARSLAPPRGTRRAGATLVLNPDAWLEAGSWLAAIGAISPDVAALGPAVVSPDGTLQSSVYTEPRPSRVLMESLGVQRFARLLGIRRIMPGTRTEVDAVQGSCIFINHRAWRMIGPFDEDFFLYHEELDWCLRARDAGFSVLYEPAVRVVHGGGVDVPAGRELVYYRGALRLVEKRRGLAEASRLRRHLRRSALLGAMLAGNRERSRGLRRLADEL